MSKRQLLSILGVWIMVFLFLGFPILWHKIIAVVSGLLVVIISYNINGKERKEEGNNGNGGEMFVENKQE